MKKFAVLLLATVVASGLMGCSKSNPTTTTVTVHDTTYVTKFIVGEFELYDWGGNPWFYEQISVYADPAPNIAQSSAYFKFGSTPLQPTMKYQIPGEIGWQDTLRFPYPGIACSLFVNTNIGSSQGGGVSIPGAYTLNSPIQGDTLPWGDVAYSWTQAQYATWYSLNVRYTAYTGGNPLGGADTFLTPTGTSVLVPQAFFRKYGSATYASVSTNVYAHNGAMPGAGGAGNLSGNIKGVFYSVYESPNSFVNFYMGSPKAPLGASPPPPPPISKEERRERLLKAFKEKFQSEAD